MPLVSQGDVRISVVIPTWNAGNQFEKALQAIQNQVIDQPFELLIIDSGSRDGTIALAARYGARVMRVPHRQFHHGRTRNQAIAEARGDLVALTVQDAIPADEHWLAELVRALEENPTAAGAYSRHIPHEGASFVASVAANFWFEMNPGFMLQTVDHWDAFAKLPMYEQQFRCTFNNVSSMVRRSVWEAIPFREIAFAEDLAWGYDVMRAGHAVAFAPESIVRHSHERSAWYELKRAYVDHRAVGELFSMPARPMNAADLMELARYVRETLATLKSLTARGLLDPKTMPLGNDLRTEAWGRAHWSRSVLARIIGPESYLWPDALEHARLELDWRYVQWAHRHGLREWHYRTDQEAADGKRWPPDDTWLPDEELEKAFEWLWDEISADYVRGAIYQELEQVHHPGLALTKARTQEYALQLARRAMDAGVLDLALYRRIWRQALAMHVGQRLGQASRYGMAGKWGHIVHAILRRNV